MRHAHFQVHSISFQCRTFDILLSKLFKYWYSLQTMAEPSLTLFHHLRGNPLLKPVRIFLFPFNFRFSVIHFLIQVAIIKYMCIYIFVYSFWGRKAKATNLREELLSWTRCSIVLIATGELHLKCNCFRTARWKKYEWGKSVVFMINGAFGFRYSETFSAICKGTGIFEFSVKILISFFQVTSLSTKFGVKMSNRMQAIAIVQAVRLGLKKATTEWKKIEFWKNRLKVRLLITFFGHSFQKKSCLSASYQFFARKNWKAEWIRCQFFKRLKFGLFPSFPWKIDQISYFKVNSNL